MDRDEILAKSRAENKNQDVYEQEILKLAGKTAVVVQMILAAVFFCGTGNHRRRDQLGVVGPCGQCGYDALLGEICQTPAQTGTCHCNHLYDRCIRHVRVSHLQPARFFHNPVRRRNYG
ncbi:MAG TPA: hypothetical protein H9860_03595 [Candidatus Gemmiger faecavium]|nr:hypothetical protein [Candidatus Gemmiger faecavium]